MMGAPIWYRHWLEIRDRWDVYVAFALLFGALPIVIAGYIDPKYKDFVAARFQLMHPVGLIGAVMVGRRGTSIWKPPYALTLPVSRVRLMWTRMAVVFVAAIVQMVLATTNAYATLLALGRSVAFDPIALATVFYVPMLMACIPVMGALVMIYARWAIAGAFSLLVIGMELNRHMVSAFLERGQMPWVSLAALLAATALGFMGCVRASRVKDF